MGQGSAFAADAAGAYTGWAATTSTVDAAIAGACTAVMSVAGGSAYVGIAGTHALPGGGSNATPDK